MNGGTQRLTHGHTILLFSDCARVGTPSHQMTWVLVHVTLSWNISRRLIIVVVIAFPHQHRFYHSNHPKRCIRKKSARGGDVTFSSLTKRYMHYDGKEIFFDFFKTPRTNKPNEKVQRTTPSLLGKPLESLIIDRTAQRYEAGWVRRRQKTSE